MGYMRHHAIIVTSYDEASITEAHKHATACGMCVSPVSDSVVNDYQSFAVFPDGSKEGWSDSDHGDTAREIFIKWMDSQRFSDGSGPLSWAEVQYGDDNRKTKVTAHSDEDSRRSAGKLS